MRIWQSDMFTIGFGTQDKQQQNDEPVQGLKRFDFRRLCKKTVFPSIQKTPSYHLISPLPVQPLLFVKVVTVFSLNVGGEFGIKY